MDLDALMDVGWSDIIPSFDSLKEGYSWPLVGDNLLVDRPIMDSCRDGDLPY